MPSGKRSKQQRATAQVKTPPPVRAKGAAGPRRASPKVLAIGGGVAILIVVAVVAIVALTGGKSNSVGTLPTTGSVQTGLPGAASVASLLRGIPQHGQVLGSPDAPVTLTEYVDLQCPFCQEFETQVMPDLIKRYVRTGKVKLQVRPLAFIGPDSIRGRNAMLAAARQDKGFNFAQLLYLNQQTENTGWLSDSMVAQAAKSIPGLNPRLLFAQRSSKPVQAEAAKADKDAQADAVKGTPTLLIGRSGTHGSEVSLASPTDEQAVVDAIKSALAS
jgi:protein-disulfide isomerase